MHDVVVVSCCTHREGFIDEYESQLAARDIPFYLDQIDLPGGANSFTILRRVNFLRKMAEMFADHKIIYATDGWDVLFFGTKQELIDHAPHSFLLGAERNCYPESHLSDTIQADGPWRFANAGLIACPPKVLLEWCDKVEIMQESDILDQAWFNRRISEGSPLISLDTLTQLFYVVSSSLEDGSLQAKNGRPWNSKTGCFPSFLHFSGKCPSDEVRSMLTQ